MKYKIIFDRYKLYENGDIYNTFRYYNIHGKIIKIDGIRKLKNRLKKNGYYSVVLYINDKPKEFLVHRLVALNFIENKYNKNQINHIDGNKLNNNYKNLEWCTQTENAKHAYNTGLVPHKTKEELDYMRSFIKRGGDATHV